MTSKQLAEIGGQAYDKKASAIEQVAAINLDCFNIVLPTHLSLSQVDSCNFVDTDFWQQPY
jgi:hypothetical protein